MRKGPGRLSLIVLMMLMTVAMLTGCGPKKPAPEEAQAYVKAVLDLMCTGDYDHSVDLADIEEGKESEVRDNLIDQMMSEIGSESNLSEEVTASFRDFMTNALGKAKYTVGAATETEDGGYDVTVSIEPLQIFTGVNEFFGYFRSFRTAKDRQRCPILFFVGKVQSIRRWHAFDIRDKYPPIIPLSNSGCNRKPSAVYRAFDYLFGSVHISLPMQ